MDIQFTNKFTEQVKDFLIHEYNIDISEDMIWIIIQIYKEKLRASGKETLKTNIKNNFKSFIDSQLKNNTEETRTSLPSNNKQEQNKTKRPTKTKDKTIPHG